jgi:hypothetical protein
MSMLVIAMTRVRIFAPRSSRLPAVALSRTRAPATMPSTIVLDRRPTGVARSAPIPAPREVFRRSREAQLEVDHLAVETPLAPRVLRTTGFLRPEAARRVADWFTGTPAARAAPRSASSSERRRRTS